MTCYEEVLNAAINIVKIKKINKFEPKEIIDYLKKNGSKYEIFTIRDEIQRGCINCAKKFRSRKIIRFKRIDRGQYCILPEYLEYN
jgi:hypothetical protein